MKKFFLAVLMGLISSAAFAGQDVTLNWTDVGNETAYEIERKNLPCGVTGTWNPLATVGADVLTYTDVNRPYSSSTCYKVRGVQGVDLGTFSNEHQVDIGPQMGTPILSGS